jgi:hypothetical protein
MTNRILFEIEMKKFNDSSLISLYDRGSIPDFGA